MHDKTLTALCLLLGTVAAGCNAHPVKQVEYVHGSGGGMGGDTDGESDTEDSDSDSGETDGDSGGNGFPDDPEGETGGADLDCGGDMIQVDAAPANVMLVLDKSGSMTSNHWDHDGDSNTADITRWHSLHGIVEGLVQAREGDTNLGAVLFPSMEAGGQGAQQMCLMGDDVEVQLAAMNAQTIMSGIPAADADTDGGTPARQGVLNAMNHFGDEDPEGPRAIVLVTDGAANCVADADPFWATYDDELQLAVESAREDLGISTYVVGIDIADDIDDDTGVNVSDELSAVASAGGVPRSGEVAYYPAADHDALQAALDEISNRVQCTVSLSTLPAAPDYVDVWVGDQAISRVDSCDQGDGWRFTSDQAPFDTIELCGAACDAFREAGTLETDYACPPEE